MSGPEDGYAARCRRWRRASWAAGVGVTCFWLVMTGLLAARAVEAYREARRIDCSVFFRRNFLNTYAYMDVYVEDTRVGFTRRWITDTPEGGKVIRGETSLVFPAAGGRLVMRSRIEVSPRHGIERVHVRVVSPFFVELEGKRAGEKMVITVPAAGYREEIDLPRGLFAAGISPFGDVGPLRPGAAWDVRFFDPLRKRMRKVRIRVVKEESVPGKETVPGRRVYLLESVDERGKVTGTAVVDESGVVLSQVVYLAGIRIRLQRRD